MVNFYKLFPVAFIFIYSFSLAQPPTPAQEASPVQKEWQTVGKKAFSDGSVYWPEINFSATGIPYVAYRDGANGTKATVKKFKNSQWVTVGQDSFSDGQVWWTKIEFSSQSNTPYVTYWDYANGDGTTVKKFDGSQWVTVGTDSFSDGEGWYQSIAFPPSSDTPYVCYSDVANGDGITVKKFNGNQWVSVGIDTFSDGAAYYTDIDFPPNSDTPYVAYFDNANGGGATVEKFDGTKWVVVGQDSFSDGQALWTSIDFDASGTPYVAYEDDAHGSAVTVEVFTGSNWIALGGDSISNTAGLKPDLEFSDSDEPYVGYRDVGNGGMTVQKYNGLQWKVVGMTAFSDGAAYSSSMAFPPSSNVPYVSYRDVANGGGATVMAYDCNAFSKPNAAFGYSQMDSMEVQFSDLSTNPGNWMWHFGDGDTSSQQNPSHQYASADTYKVCLEISNSCSSDSSCRMVRVTETTGLAEAEEVTNVQLFPNPATEKAYLQYNLPQSTSVEITLHDNTGREVKQIVNDQQQAGKHRSRLDLTDISNGVYFYQLQTERGVTTGKLVVTQ